MDYGKSLIHYFAISSPYLLLGLVAAGFIHEILKSSWPRKIVKGQGISSIFFAALLGIPLPLCSCSVIPAAVALKKSGASNEATSAFLIATPESGVDSIMMTHAMMDLPMTILRPFIAFVTAFSAGILQYLFQTNFIVSDISTPIEKSSQLQGHFIRNSLSYAFGKLINDLAIWLTLGMFLGALINIIIPEDFFLGLNPHLGRLSIIFVGIPFYICAASSTPIAAALILKGMSPGLALLFLLVGPATNISSLLVLQKYLGKKAVLINLTAIGILSLGFSYLVDFLYIYYRWELNMKVSQTHHDNGIHTWLAHLCSLILAGLLLKGIWFEISASRLKKDKTSCH